MARSARDLVYEALCFFSLAIEVEGTGAGMRGEAKFIGARDNLTFFAESERTDDGQRIFAVGHNRRHGGKFALSHHVHEQSFENVVHVVSEGELIEAVCLRIFHKLGAALGGAPVAVHRFAGFEAACNRHIDAHKGYVPVSHFGLEPGIVDGV